MKKCYLIIALSVFFMLAGRYAYAQGANISNPIVVNTLYTGSYYDSRSNAGYGDDIGQASEDVFYKFTLPVSRTVTISTCGSGFDTYLHLLNSSGTEITYNDDSGPACYGLQASISYTLAAGTYYVAVEGYALQTGTYQLTLSCTPFTQLTGTDITNPIDIGSLYAGVSYSDTKNNNPANGFGNDMGQPSDDIYYKFTLGSTQAVNISTCNSALGDTYLHILNAAGTEIYYNDDNGPACAGTKASLSVSLSAGTYYIVTEGWNTNYGDISLDVAIPAASGVNIISSYAQAVGPFFAQLEKNRVPYGLLLDQALEQTNLSDYDGVLLTDSNYVNKGSFGTLYNTLLTAKISSNGPTFTDGLVLDSLARAAKQPGTVAMAGLYYNYARFTDDAVSAGKVTITANQVYDKYVSGVWQNPYQTAAVMAIGPMSDVVEGKNQQFLLPSSLWFTNNGAAVASIQMDAGDGAGYRTVTPGTPVSVAYADTGLKALSFKLTLNNSTTLFSHARLRVIPSVLEINGNRVITNVSYNLGNGRYAEGYMTIQYANPAAGLQKPLIVVEGFDADPYLNPENRFGQNTIDDFLRDVNFSGSTALISQINPTGTVAATFDIVYVDWKDATDDIKNNALLLEKIIDNVNSLKVSSSVSNIVMGISMGGLVARWALKDMENHSHDHQTGLFISYDSPQQGANVPIGVQVAAKHMKSLFLKALDTPTGTIVSWLLPTDGAYRTLSLSNRPSARQMLINWVNDDYLVDNSVHNNWQTELRTMGYPSGMPGRTFRKIAVSNASACSLQQPGLSPGGQIAGLRGNANTSFLGDILSGGPLATLGNVLNSRGLHLGSLPGKNEISADISINATASGGGNQVYHNKITFKKTLAWVLPISTDLVNLTTYAPSTSLTMDTYAGGFYHVDDVSSTSDEGHWWGHYNIQIDPFKNFNFIPSVSSLDIGSGNTALYDWDYKTPYNGAQPPVSPYNSPFANFITATEDNSANQSHTHISLRTGNWLATELAGGTGAECLSACAATSVISGPQVVCDTQSYTVGNLPAGSTVTWSIPGGAPAWASVTWDPVTYAATISTGNPNGQLLTLTATITSPCGDVLHLTKDINMGVPPPSIVGFDQLCTNEMSDYMVNPVDGATGYHWSSPDPGVTLTPYSGGQAVHFRASTAGNYTLSLYIDTPCGTLLIPDMYIWVHDCGTGGGDGPYYYRYQGYPNPASSEMTITSQAAAAAPAQDVSVSAKTSNAQAQAKGTLKPVAFTYRIMDAKGKVWQQGRSQKGEDVKADVRHLPNGTYYLHFTAGKDVVRRQIIIKH